MCQGAVIGTEDGLTVFIAKVPIARIAREEERRRPLLQQIWENLDTFSKQIAMRNTASSKVT